MTTDTALALTREQIKAMRAADAAVLRFALDEHGYALDATLDLSKEIERTDGFGKETRHVIVPAPAIVHNYGGGNGIGRDDPLAPATKGSWILISLIATPEWVTLAHFVRAGDVLKQEWTIDNRSDVLVKSGITVHELRVRVQRPLANGRANVYTFMLDAHAEPAHGYSSCIDERDFERSAR